MKRKEKGKEELKMGKIGFEKELKPKLVVNEKRLSL